MTQETEQSENSYSQTAGATVGTPRWVGLLLIVSAAVAIAAFGLGWTAVQRAGTVEQSIAAQSQTSSHTSAQLSKRLAQAEESSASLQGELNLVTDRLKLTQGELSRARKQAKQIREDYAKDLAAVETAVKSELATKAGADQVSALSGDVAGVRGDLDSTRQNLQMARGEFGTLIARNHEEIEQLRRLGQRDYFEFTLDRKGTRYKVGDIVVELRNANTRRNQFTLALYVDDMRLEKKNRSINEPIYFYTRGSRAPLELVVNQVGKTKVAGYLSVPKGSASSSGS